jgi:alkaline phosphatase
MKKIFIIISIFISINVLQPSFDLKGQELPKNIIVFIGDGMGVSQLSAAKHTQPKLNMERFSITGLVNTAAADNLITDSAAGGTAMATGEKTYNGAISYSPKGDTLKTIFEYAEELGKKTGLVATSTITHATPAVFASHVDDRAKQDEIARQLTHSGTDVMIGGGRKYFVPENHKGSERSDDLNLLDSLKTRMNVMDDIESLLNYRKKENFAALLEMDPLPKASERGYSLADLTSKALNVLSKNENGFILIVEGSQIDWGGHENDFEYILSETIDFDKAVGVGLDFAEKNKETLVIATADHETGGMTITGGDKDGENLEVEFGTGGHTASLVPIFAYGSMSEEFSGIIDNTDIGKNFIKILTEHSANYFENAAN